MWLESTRVPALVDENLKRLIEVLVNVLSHESTNLEHIARAVVNAPNLLWLGVEAVPPNSLESFDLVLETEWSRAEDDPVFVYFKTNRV
jgi:hypothetical protein